MRSLVDSSDVRAGADLRAVLDRDGYVFLPGLLDPERIAAVRAAVVATLHRLGWLAAGSPPELARASEVAEPEGAPPTDSYLAAYAQVQRVQAFHELALEPALHATAEAIIGEPTFTHPTKIARLGVPTPSRWRTPPHQDYPLIQGSVDVLTAWVPLGDCPHDLGGLQVLPGSHRAGLQLPHAAQGVGGTAVVADEDDERWASADFRAGDVLLFHSLTVHAALPNETDRIRLSADFRYQSVRAPVRESWLHAHYYPRIPDYPELCRGWTSLRSITPPPGLTFLEPVAADELPPPRPALVTVEGGC